jgi:hypothetical protein
MHIIEKHNQASLAITERIVFKHGMDSFWLQNARELVDCAMGVYLLTL